MKAFWKVATKSRHLANNYKTPDIRTSRKSSGDQWRFEAFDRFWAKCETFGKGVFRAVKKGFSK